MTDRPYTSLNPEMNSIKSRMQPVISPTTSYRVCLVRPQGLGFLPTHQLYFSRLVVENIKHECCLADSPKNDMNVWSGFSERRAEVLALAVPVHPLGQEILASFFLCTPPHQRPCHLLLKAEALGHWDHRPMSFAGYR